VRADRRSTIYTFLLPLQHMVSMRRRSLAFHRQLGTVIFAATAWQVLSALAIVQSREMYSDPSLLHVHRLKVYGATLLIWPTFGLCAIALGLVTLPVLYMAWTTARERNIEAHKVRRRLLAALTSQAWATMLTWVRRAPRSALMPSERLQRPHHARLGPARRSSRRRRALLAPAVRRRLDRHPAHARRHRGR